MIWSDGAHAVLSGRSSRGGPNRPPPPFQQTDSPLKRFLPKQTVFSVLANSPWWISLLIAAVLYLIGRQFLPDLAALFSTFPFLASAAWSAWKRRGAPSEERVAETLQQLNEISWERFSLLVTEAFRREGCTVEALNGKGGDFLTRKAGRTSLVSCKRWKVAQTGVAPLRDLDDARKARAAADDSSVSCIYIAAGEVTAKALEFAAEKSIQVLSGAELTRFIREAGMPIVEPAKQKF